MDTTEKNGLLLDAFYNTVSRFGKKPAVYDEQSVFTYEELDKAVSLIGQKILETGYSKGTRVLIYLPRCKEVLAAALSVCKAGCVFVFTDDTYPVERLSFMLRDSDAKIILTTKKEWNSKPFEKKDALLLFLDEILQSKPVENEIAFPSVAPDDEAFVVYTSGSSGHPKGVLHSQRSLFFDVSFYPDFEPQPDESLKFCHIAGFPFRAGLIDMFSPLLYGASLVIYSEKTRLDPAILYRRMKEDKVTCLHASVRYAIHFLENYDMRQFVVRMSGEKIPSFKPLFHSKVTEIYGCSEGGCIGCCPITKTDGKIPLARPSRGVEFLLLDEKGNPSHPGEEGELAFSGPGIVLSYLNLPELTKAKIFTYNGKKWFKTGDLVQPGEDGLYYYEQRRDFMIKLRGFRIEPGEIESQVKAWTEGTVTDCVCVTRKVQGEDRLCCFYTSNEKKPVNEEKLREFLGKKLASYMIPEYFVHLDELPKNTNGKIDRSKLPEIKIDPNQESLSSLGLMRFSVEIYEKYGIRLSYEKLASLGTKEKILAYVKENEKSAAAETPFIPEKQRKESGLSFPQRGIWAECLSEPNSVRYNVPILIRFSNSVSLANIRKAVQAVVDVHPALNVIFHIASDGTVRQVLPDPVPEICFHCSSMSEEDLKTYKTKNIRPFCLTDEKPLYRMEIIQTEKGNYLFMDFHHIIFDGMSLSYFVRDLNRALQGHKLYPETFTALDIAAEQEEYEKTEKYAACREFWRSRVSLVEESSEIPADLFGKKNGCCMAKTVQTQISPLQIRSFSRSCGLKPGSIYLAALLLVIKTYTYENSIGIVTISSGRRDTRIGNDIGMFVNTLPIVCSIPSGSVQELAVMVEKISEDAVAHENYPFAAIAHELNYKPQIMFACQEGVFEELQQHGEFSVEEIGTGEAMFPLYFSVAGQDEKITLNLQYDTSLYSEEFIQNLLSAYEGILEQLCTRKDISSINLCTKEQQSWLNSLHHQIREPAPDENIISLFEESVRKFPDRTAVVFKDRTFSYRELDDVVTVLSRRLLAIGRTVKKNGHEPVIAVVVNRNENIVLASLAVLKAGYAYQPIDPDYPDERIHLMLEDASPVLILAESSFYDRLVGTGFPVMKIEENAEAGSPEQADFPHSDSHSLFTLLYTSGSTGKPKGVMLEHGNLTAFCRWYQRYYDLDENGVVASYASYGFDANMMDLYPALTCGACVCIIPKEIRLDMDLVNKYLQLHDVTHCFMTTQAGLQFYLSQENNRLRYLSVGGEKLASVRPCRTYTLVNGYGPTECTIFSVTKKVVKEEPDIPIGTPVDALNCYVLNSQDKPVPPGAVGELILAGTQVGRGYLNDTEMTRSAFFEFDGYPAYRTGDLVRYRADGDLEFVGRRDNQVKIRGFRIEPKEVELAIRQYPGIKDVTVQHVGTAETGKVLVAYVVSDKKLDGDEIKQFVAGSKPEYMVPSYIMQIDAVPLNINFKVDKRALPKPDFGTTLNYKAPSNETEKTVVSCISETLGIDTPIGINDSFLRLGGDSISAIRLSAKLRKAGFDIPASSILRLGTVAAISRVCNKAAVLESAPEAQKKDVAGSVPDTPMVRYFKNLQLKYPNHFNQCMLYKASERIDTILLKKSLEALTAYHDALRSRFTDGNLVIQKSLDSTSFNVRIQEDGDVAAAANELYDDMNIEKGPLIQACIFRQEKSDYLLLSIHHLVVDGVSWRILGSDLNQIYMAYRENKEPSLPEKTNSLIDYALSMKAYKDSHSLKAQRSYWDKVRAQIADTVQTKTEGGRIVHGCMHRETVTWTEDKYKRILDISVGLNVNADALFLAAIGKALAGILGLNKISVLREGHGRNTYDAKLNIDRTVGWFTAMYPVVIDNLKNELDELAKDVNLTLKNIPASGIGYQSLYDGWEDLMPLVTFNNLGKMDFSGKDVMFRESADLPVGDFLHSRDQFGTDLNVNMSVMNGCCTVNFTCSENVADSYHFKQFVMEFTKVLEEAASRSDTFTTAIVTDLVQEEKSKPSWSLDDAQQAVVEAFTSALHGAQNGPIEAGSDFFRLGGDQFSAAELEEFLFHRFGRIITSRQIYAMPTAAQLARFLTDKEVSEQEDLLQIYSSGEDKIPLFFIHTANSGAEAYYRLADRIGDEIAFAAVNQYNLLHLDDRCRDISALAARYIAVLKSLWPKGPYNLGGWCLGGTIAWEMARQLKNAGEKVEKLILIDSQIVEDSSDRMFMLDHAQHNAEKYILDSPLLAENRRKYPLEVLTRHYCEISQAWLAYDPPVLRDIDVFFVKATVNPGSDSKRLDNITDKLIACRADGYEKKLASENLTLVEVPQDHDSLMNDFSLDIIVPKMLAFLRGDSVPTEKDE